MIKLKNLILFELMSILLLCTVIGGILYTSDLSSFWRERYSRDAGVIRQAFLDHHNEIVNGDMRGFESTLAMIAKVYSIREFEVNSRVLGRVVRLVHDANGALNTKSARLECEKPSLRNWVTGSSACFSSDFTWNTQGQGEPLLTVTWWVAPGGLHRKRHSAILMFFATLSLGVAFCGLHWLMLRKVIVRPVSQAVERFGTWVRKDGATPSVKSLFMPKTHEISELILHFEHLINAAEDNRSLRELAIQLESTELVAKQVSHDLRSPLSALKVSVDSMAKSPSDEAKALAQKAFVRVNEILATLDQKSGRIEESPTPGKTVKTENVVFLVESILAEHSSQIDRQKIALHFQHACERELFIQADCAALKRALSNLITNALESLVEARAGEVEIGLQEVGSKICVSIRDNGRGIPAHVLHRLGERGFSFGKEYCRLSGSGLGVFQAKTAIEGCGGRIDYQSQIELGTTVTVTLPQADPPESWTERIPSAPLMVVVDDDVTVHRSWREKLSGLNCRLQCFLSSNKFETWLKNERPNLDQTFFFFDFSLGPHEPNGFELIVRNRLPAKRVILISGIADSLEVQIQAERFGTKLIHKRYFATKDVAALDELAADMQSALNGPA